LTRMRVLGIDPSVRSTGYGVIEYSGSTYTVLDCGAIKPPQRLLFHDKINLIRKRLEEIIQAFQPDEVAIENPFYARNIRTAITLGQVRGAVLVAVADGGCPLHEYSPLEIKKAVTGYGQADKEQVKTMIQILLPVPGGDLGLDASDALAAAFCHLNTRMFERRIQAGERKQEKKG